MLPRSWSGRSDTSKAPRYLLIIALTWIQCGGAAAPPSAPASTIPPVAASVTPTPGTTPTATASAEPSAPPSPAATAPPSSAPSAPPSPAATATAPAGAAPYCAVADVPTPIADYDRHAETYLDWTYLLPDGYEPPDLVFALTGAPRGPVLRAVEVPRPADLLLRRGDPAYLELLADDRQALVRQVIYDDLTAMRAAATAAGVRIVVLSAYRSYARQQATFDYWVNVSGYERALDASARPGHSEHQLGTTIDFGDAAAAPWEYADWAGTPSGAWLRDHAREFGFVMSYPSGSKPVTCYDYEPWHYRWVGRELANEIAGRSIPLRDYQAGRR